MAGTSIVASIIGTAGAGFRLSLILNAIGSEITNADVEIQSIARGISMFSLMLKQVGVNMDTSKAIASQIAIDTAGQIANQSRSLFDEIKNMVEMVQKKDERGNIQSIMIAQKVKWCLKKQRVHYLLGQLESLKLSLALMLQVLQLGKAIATAREEPSKPPPSEKAVLQERAEIQNMVVVRHWSLVELRRLYQLAEHEDVDAIESPLPSYNGLSPAEGDPRLSIEPPKTEADQSKALVKYQETPLSYLDASMNKAMYLPNRLLHAPDDNVVDHLLEEWTRLREMYTRSRRDRRKYDPYYDTDDDSDSEIDFERSEEIGGQYIEAPKSKKNVRFRTRVDSDSEDSDQAKHRRRPSTRHVLHSDDDSDSDSSSPLPRPARRNSEGSSPRHSNMQEQTERSRRPYPTPYTGTPQNPTSDPQSARPNSRSGLPPPANQPRQMPTPTATPTQSWQNQSHPTSPGLRPPPYNPNFPPSPQRMPSAGPYGMPPPPSAPPVSGMGVPPPGYGTSPQAPRNYIPQSGPGLLPPYQSQNGSQTREHRHKPRSPRREKSSKSKTPGSFRENAKKDVKRGLLGAGAVAGLMDILEGLGTI